MQHGKHTHLHGLQKHIGGLLRAQIADAPQVVQEYGKRNGTVRVERLNGVVGLVRQHAQQFALDLAEPPNHAIWKEEWETTCIK